MAKAASRRHAPTSGARRIETPPPAQGGRGVPFLLGLCCGIALTMLFTRGEGRTLENPLPKAGTAESIPEVRFEFPEVLRDAEVLVPYVEEYLDGEAKPEDVGEYLLQAGAFRSSEDADRRRAMILLQDLPARTVAVRRDGGTWHRVLVGPFESRRAARAAQLALLREDIDSLVLRSEP